MGKIISAAKVQKRFTNKALVCLIARLRGQQVKDIVRWTRDELYEDTQ